MRTQEEIRIISEEIRINVQKAIIKEEHTKSIEAVASLIKTHQPDIMTCMGIVSMVHATYESQKKLLRAQSYQLKMERAFEEYRQRVEERL
jgi:hypothetical protein